MAKAEGSGTSKMRVSLGMVLKVGLAPSVRSDRSFPVRMVFPGWGDRTCVVRVVPAEAPSAVTDPGPWAAPVVPKQLTAVPGNWTKLPTSVPCGPHHNPTLRSGPTYRSRTFQHQKGLRGRICPAPSTPTSVTPPLLSSWSPCRKETWRFKQNTPPPRDRPISGEITWQSTESAVYLHNVKPGSRAQNAFRMTH